MDLDVQPYLVSTIITMMMMMMMMMMIIITIIIIIIIIIIIVVVVVVVTTTTTTTNNFTTRPYFSVLLRVTKSDRLRVKKRITGLPDGKKFNHSSFDRFS